MRTVNKNLTAFCVWTAMLMATSAAAEQFPGKQVLFAEGAAEWSNDGAVTDTPGCTVAEIRPYNGVPTLFLNGKPNAGMTYMTYNPQAKHFASFGKAGNRTLRLPRRTPVYDLYEQRLLSEDAQEITFDLPAKTTKLLLLGKP